MDPRVARTRRALLDAFFELVQERDYDDIRVEEIADRAAVSRSTFYTHHAGKDALLAASLAGPFRVLADALQGVAHAQRLRALLDHFWSNRAMARSLLTGAMRRRTTAVLVTLIEERVRAQGFGHPGALVLPLHLCAVQLAETLLAPITVWLLGKTRCDASSLAHGLCRVSAATVEAMKTVP